MCEVWSHPSRWFPFWKHFRACRPEWGCGRAQTDAPENLTRIFNHGFTTRTNRHGFGLQSGALAASQLGGTLLAQSDGPGKGATFVLDLPVHRKEPPT